MMGGLLWVLCFVGLFLFLMVIITGSREMYLIYLGFGVILYSLYLIYDTQLIVGKDEYHFKISIDDYILGAMVLYIDIIMLFIKIL
mmetsp:Transcript_1293/g.114  ORF Transcript_1293/g.114 Transcript_1293/m.114 type:complete len:86 (-) Transcript_1293:5-262(-)